MISSNTLSMNRRILNLAIPNVISNITIPLLGMVDIAIAGRLTGSTDASIGAIAIGAAIFDFIYWNCAFIRMGTSGLTAQAFGARNFAECANILARSVVAALVVAILLLVFQNAVGAFSLGIMHGSETVQSMAREYFFARIWAAPATISLYAIHGWFIGMQNSKTPMVVAIAMNGVNIGVSLLLVYKFDMGIKGIAWGTVAAQYSGVIISWIFWAVNYRRFARYISMRESIHLRPMLHFLNVNKDIFIRTACVVAVYTFFTSASSGMGDTTLAINTLLMQLFTLFSYMSDGLAYAAESLVGKFVGAGNRASLRHCIVNLFYWGLGIAVAFIAIYLLFWRDILSLFTTSDTIISGAGAYIIWIVLVPLLGFGPFLLDGILIGATRTKILRNTMFFATLIFFALYYSTINILGNDALWLSFIIYLIARGVLQYFATDRLRILTHPSDYSS